jgi:thiamine-phosphate pyrophosphorylase
LRTLHDCHLYGIIDLGYVPLIPDCNRIAQQMIEGGVDLIQLRGKGKSIDDLANVAAALHEITSRFSIPFIVNDHAEVARSVGAEGVHLGQDDDSIQVARQKAGRKALVGKSTHSIDQAHVAQREGADYIGFGPIFATPTKPDYTPIGLSEIKKVHSDANLPIFCIGGIKLENLKEVIAAGGQRIAIVSGLLKAPDIIEYARACKRLLLDIKHQTSNIEHS